MKIRKLDSFIALVFWVFLDLDKFLDLDLDKFRIFKLAKISTISFSPYFILSYLLLLTLSSSIIFTDIIKYFTNFVKIIVSIKVSNLVIF